MLKQNSFSDKLFHSGVKEQNGENSGQAACHPSVFVSQAEECWHEYLPNSVSPSRVLEFNMICFSPFDLNYLSNEKFEYSTNVLWNQIS